jgi:hypothetical protein
LLNVSLALFVDSDLVMMGERWYHGGTVVDGGMVVFLCAVIVDLVPGFVDGDVMMVSERW